jgi:small GTP-binding protein
MKKNEEIKELVEKLKEAGISLTEDQVAQLAGILEKDFSYVPKIGVFGKTGAGKSSFVNAILGQDVCPVSDVEACTRELQEANVGGIILVDCPGIAESAERDEEYKKLYTELIPKLDAIIWVLKGDDRSYGPDLEFYELIKHCFKTEDGKNAPVFFALNQVDKIYPCREWNEKDCEPGDNQRKNIEKIVSHVAGLFKTDENHVVPISSSERYNLPKLVGALVNSLPANKALIVLSPISETTIKNGRSSEITKVLDIRKRRTDDYLKNLWDKGKEIWDKYKEPIKAVFKVVVSTLLPTIAKKYPVLGKICKRWPW